VALLLAGLRVAGLWGGLRWAARDPAVGADWANYGWLGLVSQGGLAVTLAAVLRRAFPEWNVSLEALLVAMIGVQPAGGADLLPMGTAALGRSHAGGGIA